MIISAHRRRVNGGRWPLYGSYFEVNGKHPHIWGYGRNDFILNFEGTINPWTSNHISVTT